MESFLALFRERFSTCDPRSNSLEKHCDPGQLTSFSIPVVESEDMEAFLVISLHLGWVFTGEHRAAAASVETCADQPRYQSWLHGQAPPARDLEAAAAAAIRRPENWALVFVTPGAGVEQQLRVCVRGRGFQGALHDKGREHSTDTPGVLVFHDTACLLGGPAFVRLRSWLS